MFGRCGSFRGEATTAERIMQRAGQDSAKPSDLFKIKAKGQGQAGACGTARALWRARGHAATRGVIRCRARGRGVGSIRKEVAMT